MLSPQDRLEIAMRALTCVAAVAVLAGTLAACADPYYYSRYPSYGYAYQSYSSPGMTVTYTTGPSYAYSYPSGYSYGYNSAGWDYYRNYHGIHPGPEYYP
jgi:hypothetical protein